MSIRLRIRFVPCPTGLRSVGNLSAKVITAVLSSRRHSQQCYRSCLGILRLGKSYGNERLEAASQRALLLGTHRYKRIESILKNGLAKMDVLILDDWCLSKLTVDQRRDLLKILEARHDMRSTIVTSQLPINKRHQIIGDPTLADTILDRLVHSAYKIYLKGESMRKKKTKLTSSTESE